MSYVRKHPAERQRVVAVVPMVVGPIKGQADNDQNESVPHHSNSGCNSGTA
jgi:hypothetical protein